MEEKCPTNCTHYVDKNSMRLYKKSFLLVLLGATILVVAIFGLLERRYSQSLDAVVECHKVFAKESLDNFPAVELSRDTCFYLNEQLLTSVRCNMQDVQALLELQSNKIQSDFTILSIWAGILMIVFLIFSIYSMFKTDELVKQSRRDLQIVEDAKEKVNANIQAVEETAKNEMSKITAEAQLSINNYQEQVNLSFNSLQDQFKQKEKQFLDMYNQYVQKLDMASKMYKSVADTIKAAVSQQAEESNSES